MPFPPQNVNTDRSKGPLIFCSLILRLRSFDHLLHAWSQLANIGMFILGYSAIPFRFGIMVGECVQYPVSQHLLRTSKTS
jgi:hypothetical protein